MNKEAIATYALKSLVINNNKQDQVELAAKKHWWSKSQTPDSILSLEERKLLKRVKARAHFLDRGISCCCFQIGFDGLVGFIPVIGDFIGLLMALQLLHICMEAQLPQELISKMMFNIAFDFVIGLVPIIGDIMDIMYKCNTKNAVLLETYLIKRRRNLLRDNPNMVVEEVVGSNNNTPPAAAAVKLNTLN